MKKALLLLVLLMIPAVNAQLPWSITELRCGNDKLDDFELCEGSIESPNYCDDLGELLKIDTVCYPDHCTCLPRVNMAYCGNDRREGVEVCDGTGEDLCPELGKRMNLSLECDTSTCGCAINETIPEDYNPLVIEELENASTTPSVCGNKKVERSEDCDPPDTLCTTDLGEPGICTENCRCLEPGALDEPETEEIEVEEPVVEAVNETEMNDSETIQVNESEPEVNNSEVIDEPDDEAAKGFFGKLWAWIVSIFS